jgi:hypothetical protein
MAGLGWMIGLGHELPPHGLLTMTGPLPPLIIFAYNVQKRDRGTSDVVIAREFFEAITSGPVNRECPRSMRETNVIDRKEALLPQQAKAMHVHTGGATHDSTKHDAAPQID